LWSKYPEIKEELIEIENYIKKNTKARNKLLDGIVSELISAGGKRLRPAFVVISSKFGKYDRKKVMRMAAALEILHTATLVHDDIIDRAKTRRGKATVSGKYGFDMAVYTGDFLLSKAVLVISKGVPLDSLGQVARGVKTICEGEVDQYQQKNAINTTVLSYLKRAGRKTAGLFAASCGLGAHISECPMKVSRELTKFGYYYGMAFQMKDDLNDFLSDENSSGKPVGKDILEGVITLPVIYAVNSSRKVRDEVGKFIENADKFSSEDLKQVLEVIRQSGGIEHAKGLMKKYVEKAMKSLNKLPDNKYRNIMKELLLALNE